jgi:hypothetical protein
VLGGDVVVAERERLPEPELERFLGFGRERDLTARPWLGAARERALDLGSHGGLIGAEGCERLGGWGVRPAPEGEQDVLGPDPVARQLACLVRCEPHDVAGILAEALEHVANGTTPSATAQGRRLWRNRCASVTKL